MGRHGGGSRSGGRRSSSSRGGSSGVQSSSKPFRGCYNRCYYHRGVWRSYYTNDEKFGLSKSRVISKLFTLILVSAIWLSLIIWLALSIFRVGEKVNGDPSRIIIQDTIDVLTPEEEQKVLDLFQKVYAKSGMPVTLYTDDMEWQDKYESIEVYSEELYYAMGVEEDAMIVLYTYDGTFEWVYDIFCGDDTYKCLSYITFDKLLDNFQKGMAGQNLYDALDFSFNSIMDELAEDYVDTASIIVLVVIGLFFLLCFAVLRSSYAKEKNAYEYFKANPEKVNHTPMLVKNECPSCGAPNTKLVEACEYCGTVLKLEE